MISLELGYIVRVPSLDTDAYGMEGCLSRTQCIHLVNDKVQLIPDLAALGE